jgi:hypothetical protein
MLRVKVSVRCKQTLQLWGSGSALLSHVRGTSTATDYQTGVIGYRKRRRRRSLPCPCVPCRTCYTISRSCVIDNINHVTLTLDLRFSTHHIFLTRDQPPRYATRLAMTALQHLYPKYRAHAASTIHRRRYSPQSFVYTVVLFSALGLAGYFYRSDPTLHTPRHSYTTLDRRDVGPFASTDEEVRLRLARFLIHLSDNPHSADSSTRPPINVAT